MGLGLRQKYGDFWWAVIKLVIHVAIAVPATWGILQLAYWNQSPYPRLGSVWFLMAMIIAMEVVQNARGQEQWKFWLDLATWLTASAATVLIFGR